MTRLRGRGLSFGNIVHRYDRFRPTVPTQALDWLLPSGCHTVVDLGAGTGALTRRLVDRAPHVVGVEPDPRMRDMLARNCPGARPLPGTAERIPLPDGCADALLISMAWHWMDPHVAMPEIARVLRGAGTFGVLWNHRDLSVSWVADLDRFTRAERGRWTRHGITPVPTHDVADPPTGSLFSPFAELLLRWLMPVTAEEIVGMLGTDASAIALSTEAQIAVDDRVAGYLYDELGLKGDKTIELPMACRCLRTTRCPEVVT